MDDFMPWFDWDNDDEEEFEDIAKWLFDGKILVTRLEKNENSLENYYMELLGRAQR